MDIQTSEHPKRYRNTYFEPLAKDTNGTRVRE